MLKVWHDSAWSDYLWWQENDRKKVKRINRLILEAERGEPIGKAERLKYSQSGLCSARVDDANRLVYKVEGDERIVILSCRGHYR